MATKSYCEELKIYIFVRNKLKRDLFLALPHIRSELPCTLPLGCFDPTVYQTISIPHSLNPHVRSCSLRWGPGIFFSLTISGNSYFAQRLLTRVFLICHIFCVWRCLVQYS